MNVHLQNWKLIQKINNNKSNKFKANNIKYQNRIKNFKK